MRLIENIQLFKSNSDSIEDDNINYIKKLHGKTPQYHYFIDKTGTIYDLKPIDKINSFVDKCSIDIIVSGGGSFTLNSLQSLKFLINNLRHVKFYDIILDEKFNNFYDLQQKFNIH